MRCGGGSRRSIRGWRGRGGNCWVLFRGRRGNLGIWPLWRMCVAKLGNLVSSSRGIKNEGHLRRRAQDS